MSDLWIYEVARQGAVKLTTSDDPDANAAWSADGRTVVYTRSHASTHRLFTKTVDDGRPERPLEAFAGEAILEDWSAGGRYLAARVPRDGLWIIPLDARQKPWAFRQDSRATVWQSEFSPGGQWLAYMSDASGSPRCSWSRFPRPVNAGRSRRAGAPSRIGAQTAGELFYLAGNGTLTAIDVSSPGWQNRRPTPLFRLAVAEIAGQSDYDVAPDGQTFVAASFIAESGRAAD